MATSTPSDPFGSGLLLSDGEQLPTLMANGDSRDRFVLSARTIATATINADLVYLSACVSGRHDIRPGDEILTGCPSRSGATRRG
jgi:CHAT domain